MGYREYPKRDLSDPSHLFNFHLSALRVVTMWKLNDMKYHTPFMILFFWNVTVLSICTVGLFIKGCTTDDLVDRSEAMDIFTLTGSAMYKMVYFIYYHDDLVDMITCGLALTEKLPKGWTKHCTLFAKFHCCGGIFCMTFWGLVPMFKTLLGETTLEEMKLPINTYYPFEGRFAFSVTYSIAQYALMVSGQIYMAADIYLFTSIYVAVGALQYISDELEKMNENSNLKIADVGKVDQTHEHLKECMELHVNVLDYIRKTDKLFRSMILADVVHAIISLSFAMLQASEAKGLFEGLKMAVFVVVCFLHQFLNSHFGQTLIDKQDHLIEKIRIAVPWREASRSFKKSYHIMITSNTNAIKLSAWSAYYLQYATFLEFSKSMISYYMVLRELQDQEEVP
uniref:Odorant receptor n=1 Tax=Adelphocoris lineolatus TaxID=236346 RepID=A0A2I4PH79_ADELI|nr:olfactory receptor 67 [Adelphocoris lineolatus]